MGVAKEVVSFLTACLIGFGMGALYDLFRISRVAVKTNGVIVFFEDVIYCAAAALAVLYVILEQNGGTVRAFSLGGILIGAIIYFFTLSMIVMKAAKYVIKFLKRAFKAVFKALNRIFSPLVYIFGKIIGVIMSLSAKCKNFFKKIYIKSNFHLKS